MKTHRAVSIFRHIPSLLFGLMLAFAAIPSPRAGNVSRIEIQAAFLYNFAKFISWPSQTRFSNGRLVLCVAGDAETRRAIGALSGKKVGDLVIEVHTVTEAGDTEPCHLIHMADGWSDTFEPAAISRQGLLTVGTGMEFAQQGGVIAFFEAERKQRFAINVAAARKAELQVDAKLLNLARIIRNP